METYELNIAKCKRFFPIVCLGPKVKVVSFNMLGDVELVKVCAQLLYEHLRKFDFDYLVGPEVKTVPLLQELSNLCGKNFYIVCRKKIHGYMTNPIVSDSDNGFVINGPDAERISHKKIVVIDDVVSTGKTLQAIRSLLEKCEAIPVKYLAVAKQGEQTEDLPDNFYYLTKLPLLRLETGLQSSRNPEN